MKASQFAYHAPRERAELLKLLNELEDARVIAGGQSLVPMMNLRLAAPSNLIDLNSVADLSGISIEGERLVIGAMTRQRSAERSPLVSQYCPLLVEALNNVGFQQTRNRGTVGGSVAHMDPTAEIVVACYALGADVVLESVRGERRLAIADFPTGYLTTQIEPDEVLVRIEIPLWSPGHGAAFQEVTRRGESFSVVSVAALVEVAPDGFITRTALAVGGLGATPICLDEMHALVGQHARVASIESLSMIAAALPADGDMVVSSEYKQYLASVLTRRTIRSAMARAWGRDLHG